MSTIKSAGSVHLVRGPGLRQRLERRVARTHHQQVLGRLRRFRQGLERDMQPEPWTDLQAPPALSHRDTGTVLLAEVCEALALTAEERASVLGREGERALQDILGARFAPCPRARITRR